MVNASPSSRAHVRKSSYGRVSQASACCTGVPPAAWGRLTLPLCRASLRPSVGETPDGASPIPHTLDVRHVGDMSDPIQEGVLAAIRSVVRDRAPQHVEPGHSFVGDLGFDSMAIVVLGL